LSPPSRLAHELPRTGPVTVHEKIFFGLLVALAFLMPFKFGFFSLDMLPNPNFGGPSIGSLLVPLASWPTEIAELLIVLAAFFWLLGMIMTRRLTFRYTRADFFLWAFLVVGLVSSFLSILPHSAVIFMKEFACWALLYHLVVNLPGDERRERTLVAALMAGMVCGSLIGLHQRLIGYEQMIQQAYRFLSAGEQEATLAILERDRVMGTFASPNSLGGLYALLLPTACLFVLVLRQWTRKHGAAATILYSLFGPVLAFAIFILTESKGAFLSLGIVAVAVALTMQKRLKIDARKLLAILVPVLVAAAVIAITPPGQKLIERGGKTFKQRVGYWRGAARMAADRPVGRNLVGSGFNAFSVLFPKYKDPPDVVREAKNVHNNYVQLFVEVGVLGLAAFVAFWIIQLVRAGPIIRTFARGREPLTFKTLVVLAAFFGLLGFLLHSVVDFDLYVAGIAMTAMLLVGLMARHTGVFRQKTLVLRKEIHAVGTLAVLMVVTAPVVLFVPMPLTAEVHFFNAHWILTGQTIERPTDPYGAAIGEVHQALGWDPLNHNFMGYLARLHAARGLQERNPNDLDEADGWYTRALKLNPNSYAFRYRRAIVRLERMRLAGKVEWAPILDEIKEAVAHYPTDSFMRLRYVYSLDEAGRDDEAKRQFDIAAGDDPDNFSLALKTAKSTYNEFDFAAELERLRAKYGPTDEPHENSLGE